MKFLKKATLAAAIAAAPFAAQAELKAMDDSSMSATTGQAGIIIETTIGGAGISIGEIEYTDTDTKGSVALEQVRVNNITNLTQEINVDGTGSVLITSTSTVDDMSLKIGGEVDSTAYSAVELRSAPDAQGVRVANELVESVDLTLDLGSQSITVHNLGATTLGAKNTALAGTTAANLSNTIAIEVDGSLAIEDLDVELFGKSTDVSGDAVVSLQNIQFYNDADNDGEYDDNAAEQVSLTDTVIYAVDATASTALGLGGNAGVVIQSGNIAGTLQIGKIGIGDGNIGQVALKNINLAGMTTVIRGSGI